MEEHAKLRHSIHYYKALKTLLGAVSMLRIVCPSLDNIVEAEMFGFISTFDWLLLFWVPVLNIFGNWVKKKRLPEWVFPTPVLVILFSFVICAIAGCLRTNLEGTARTIWVLEYSIWNGCLISFCAIVAYDIWDSGFIQMVWSKIKTFFEGIIANLKKKEEGK